MPDQAAGQKSPFTPIPLGILPDCPLVSILMANYNYGSYIATAIDSVLRQDYLNFELIICDDGSTDGSREIIESYRRQDSRVKTIFQPNRGQASAFNVAFDHCRGSVVCLLDSDDVFSPKKLSAVVRELRSAPDSGFLINRMKKIGREGQVLGEIPVMNSLPSGWLAPQAVPAGPKVMRGLPPSSGLSLRREVAEEVFPLPDNLKTYADTMIQILAPMITPILGLDEPLSSYRIHGANASGRSAFTAAQLCSRAKLESELWTAWRNYLERLPGVSEKSIPREQPVSLWSYAQARYERNPNARQIYRSALAGGWTQVLPRAHRLFWKASIFFPNLLFRTSLAFVYGQSAGKIAVSRLAGALRKSQVSG
jgi:glycosyltransferase involved in cell wall biosynthesis